MVTKKLIEIVKLALVIVQQLRAPGFQVYMDGPISGWLKLKIA